MALEVEFFCPLGSECESVSDNKIKRCVGVDANTGKDVDDWACAMAWMPTLQVEMSSTNRGQTQALESFRNETVRGQKEFNQIIYENKKSIGSN